MSSVRGWWAGKCARARARACVCVYVCMRVSAMFLDVRKTQHTARTPTYHQFLGKFLLLGVQVQEVIAILVELCE